VTIASCLVSADLRGVDTHGICRLPGYLDRVRRSLINPRPTLKPHRVTPVAASLDGQDAFGFVVGKCAIKEAMAMARDFGLGLVTARRSTHFGMAASYVLPAIEAGYIAMVFSNASPAMPPWGGREGLLGTNPFAVGAPGGKLPPFLILKEGNRHHKQLLIWSRHDRIRTYFLSLLRMRSHQSGAVSSSPSNQVHRLPPSRSKMPLLSRKMTSRATIQMSQEPLTMIHMALRYPFQLRLVSRN